jgi:hypothetical protein
MLSTDHPSADGTPPLSPRNAYRPRARTSQKFMSITA